MIRRGIGVQSFVSAGGFDADAQAVITAIESTGVTLTATQKTACNTLVNDLKGYGIWTKFKAVYGFLGGTAGAHKWNWKNPADTDAAFRLVFAGGITHSSNGVLFGGVNGYADSFLNTSTQTTFNNLHLSFYNRVDTATSFITEMGCIDNSTTFLPLVTLAIKRTEASITNRFVTCTYSFISPDVINVNNTDAKGFYLTSRTASNSYKGFKNGVQQGSTVTTNSQITAPNRTIYIGALNSAGTASAYIDRQCAFASIGDGLTDTEAANLYTAVQKYQTSLSRNV